MSWKRFFNNSDPEFHAKVLVSLGIGGFLGWKFMPKQMFSHCVVSEVNTLKNHKYYTIFTSGFAEKDGLQCFFNCLTLWFFATPITHSLGAQGLYALYFSGSLAHFIGNYIQTKQSKYYSRSLPVFTTERAAVASVLSFYILQNPWSTIYLFVFPVPAILLGFLMLVLGSGKEDYNANLFGASGALFVFLLRFLRR